MPQTLSLKAYMINSIYSWLVNSDLTPYLLVDAECDAVNVPRDYVEDGVIVLNLSADAIEDFFLDEMGISFVATFSQEPWEIFVPLDAVLALYDGEHGCGIYLSEDGSGWYINEGDSEQVDLDLDSLSPSQDEGDKNDSQSKKPKKGKPNLRLVD